MIVKRIIIIIIIIIITSSKVKITCMRSGRFVCHPISQFHWNLMLWLGLPVGRTDLTFGGDPVLDIDSVSLFQFPHHCGVGDFRRFIYISSIFTGHYSRHSAQWLMPTRWWIYYILEWSGRHPDLNLGWLLVEVRCLSRSVHSLSTVSLLLLSLLMHFDIFLLLKEIKSVSYVDNICCINCCC